MLRSLDVNNHSEALRMAQHTYKNCALKLEEVMP
jgi:hypothetical protein